LSKRPSRILDPGAPPRAHGEGFPALVRETAAAASGAGDQYSAVETLLTFDGRVPVSVRRRSLGIESLAAFDAIQARSGRSAVAHSLAGIAPDGRVRVGAPGPLGSRPSGVEAVGVPVRVSFGLDAHRRYAAARHALEWQADADRREVLRWTASAGAKVLRRALAELDDVASHSPPLWFYVHDRVYSNFYTNNLAGKVLLPTSEDSLGYRLDPQRPAEWDVDDATLVYCASLLLAAGGMPQLEAFNGTQLLPFRVAVYLRERLDAYRGARHPLPASYGARASAASELAQERDRVGHTDVLYRRIHGVILNKEERLLPVSAVCEAADELVAAGAQPAADAAYDARAFEAALEHVVRIAVRLTGADLGMTRGLRSPGELIRAIRADAWTEIVEWDIYRYFCCVVSSDALARDFDDAPGDLADLLWSIAARMQYNSWHFVPGNLPWCEPVERRDHFFPPILPDIADWSDQHHRGHVVNSIRFTVRAPVAVRIAGRRFAAFTDVRLVRRGARFEPDALAVAIAASRLVAATTEAFAEHAERTGVDMCVEAFTPEWYAHAASRSLGAAPA